MARTSWKQIRLEESLYRGCAVAAAADGRSITNWIERTLTPIVAAELGDESATRDIDGSARAENGAARGTASQVRASDGVRRSGSRRSSPKPARWMGCAKHPKQRGVSGKGDKMVCGEPGCPNLARKVQP
jgi:hypothetical protein